MSVTELRKAAKAQKIPLYTTMNREQLESAVSTDMLSIGWRWNYIKPHIAQSEHREVMRLLLGPVRDLTRHKKVMDYLKKHEVHTTMTTSPERLHRIRAVLATLDLTYITRINVVLPYLYGRDKKPYDEAIIKEIATFPKVRIVRTKKDYGPITKMLPVLRMIKDPKAIVISIDDDVGYPIGMVNELIYVKVKRHPNAIVETTEGLNPREWIENFKEVWPQKRKPRIPYADLVEGWMGVAYSKNVVDLEKMEKVSNTSKECFLSDDIVISYVLAKNNVPVVRLFNKYAGFPYSYLYGTGDDALMRGGGMGQVVDVAHLSDEYNLKKYEICLDGIKHNK
jgi:hypothetical protein